MLVLFLIFSINCAQEIELSRKTYDEINETQQVDTKNFQDCPQAYNTKLEFNYNNTLELCQMKDVFYNFNVKLNDKEQHFSMFIDLIGPWSWYKSQNCEFYNQTQQVSTNISKDVCTSNDYKNAMTINQTEPKISEIKSFNNSLQGEIVSVNITLGNYTLDIDMLQVNKIYSKNKYLADGALSLANFNNQFNHSFINKYCNISKKNGLVQFLHKTNKLKLSINDEIKQDQNYETFWYNTQNSSNQWKLNVKQVSIYEKKLLSKNIDIDAVLTLTSQFIQLPKEIIETLIQTMSSTYQYLTCFLVDSNNYLVKCENLTNYQMENMKFTLQIQNESYVIKDIKLKCQTNTKANNDCLLKIKCSSSNTIFLGEPFFKDREVYLNYSASLIGITREKQIPPPVKQDPFAISNLQSWVIGLTLLLVIAFCLMNLKHVVKWLIRAIRYRRTQNLDDEQQLQNKEVEFQGMEKSEEMTQSIEENSI